MLNRRLQPVPLKVSSKTQRMRYSILSAFMGEMEAARLAGMMAAKKEQIASDIVATLNAGGSQEETPYN